MIEDEPNLVTSGLCQRVVVDGYPFVIEIFRLEADETWTLEVVDHENASYVWDAQFPSDGDALNTALQMLGSDGAIGFMRRDNVIPFRRT